jgi:hypothetical protein
MPVEGMPVIVSSSNGASLGVNSSRGSVFARDLASAVNRLGVYYFLYSYNGELYLYVNTTYLSALTNIVPIYAYTTNMYGANFKIAGRPLVKDN